MAKKTLLVVLSLIAFIAPVVSGSILPPPLDDPVVNGEFELFVPSQAAGVLEGSPLDECIGIGHQLFYGSETWQQRAEDAARSAADDDTDGAAENLSAAAGMLTGSPLEEASFFAGYGHCVYSNSEGQDVVWLNTVSMLQRPAFHWSTQDDNTKFGDFTGTGDREARINANTSVSTHNMWQAYPSPHQAYTGNFEALKIRVENESLQHIPNGASVIISFSATPLEVQTPWVLLFLDCQLRFPASLLKASATPIEGTDGHQISVSPTEGSFTARPEPSDCDVADDWADADEDERREILGRHRMVQLSFWSFNRGTGDVLIDGVSLSGTTTFAEEAAGGNIDL